MKILLFISSSLLFLTSCSNFICKKATGERVVSQNVMFGSNDTVIVRKFRATINIKTAEMTGILITKKTNDSTSAGSFINEFGIKGFDFIITERGAKLGYTFKNLDKWYIRKMLEKDLHFMFYKPDLKSVCYVNDTLAYVVNISPRVHYVYYITGENNTEHADMYKRARKSSSLQKIHDDKQEMTLKMRHLKGSLRYEFYEIKN